MVDVKHGDDDKSGPQSALPRHVAIIMDGNRRWASQRRLPRQFGHRQGVEAVRTIVRAAGDMGVPFLTLYGFSSENWNRPADEVSDLMGLLRLFIRRDLKDLNASNVKIKIIGGRKHLEDDIVSMIEEAESMTASNTGLTLVIAFNYGGRNEIATAMQRIALKVKSGLIDPDSIDTDMVAEYLDTVGIPDPDLVIRTSGEKRLSNFLIWQAAYAEFVFTDAHWPDFTPALFREALQEYNRRERRFGARLDADEDLSAIKP